MKKAIPVFLLLSTLIFNSCNRKSARPDTNDPVQTLPYLIDLEKSINNPKIFPISRIGKTIEYIPLETTSSSLIRRITQVVLSDSFIFISDFNRVLQFKRDGQFVRQVGANGRGPGEYIYASGFCIDDIKKRIYISAWSIKTILEFDFEGKFVGQIPQNIPSTKFQVYGNNKIIFQHIDMPVSTQNNSTTLLAISDTLGKIILNFKNHHLRYSASGLMIGEVPLYNFNGITNFKQFGADTMFTVRIDKLEPYAIFNLGKLKMDPDPSIPIKESDRTIKMKELEEKFWIKTLLEDPEFIFIGLSQGLSDSSKYFIYNKQSGEISFLKNAGLNNDLDGTIAFWPKYIYKDSILVDHIEAFKLLEMIKKKGNAGINIFPNFQNLQKIKDGLSETSNPVLIILR